MSEIEWLAEQLASRAQAKTAAGFASGAQSLQPDLDAAAAALASCRQDGEAVRGQLATLQESYDVLQAKYDAEHQLKIEEIIGFGEGNKGRRFPGSFVGDGPERTRFLMREGSSAETPPVWSGTGPKPTNPYRMLYFGGADAGHMMTGLEVGEFSAYSTNQLPTTNAWGGLQIAYAIDPDIHGIDARYFPGYASGPPGETFIEELLGLKGARLRDHKLDGTALPGNLAAATLLGATGCLTGDYVVDGLVARNAVYGFGLALFQCAGHWVFNEADFSGNRKALNLEDMRASVLDFNGCDFRGTAGARYLAQISSKGSSAVVNFRDCLVDQWPAQARMYPQNAGGTQKETDVHWIENDVDVTANPERFAVTHAG